MDSCMGLNIINCTLPSNNCTWSMDMYMMGGGGGWCDPDGSSGGVYVDCIQYDSQGEDICNDVEGCSWFS